MVTLKVPRSYTTSWGTIVRAGMRLGLRRRFLAVAIGFVGGGRRLARILGRLCRLRQPFPQRSVLGFQGGILRFKSADPAQKGVDPRQKLLDQGIPG